MSPIASHHADLTLSVKSVHALDAFVAAEIDESAAAYCRPMTSRRASELPARRGPRLRPKSPNASDSSLIPPPSLALSRTLKKPSSPLSPVFFCMTARACATCSMDAPWMPSWENALVRRWISSAPVPAFAARSPTFVIESHAALIAYAAAPAAAVTAPMPTAMLFAVFPTRRKTPEA